MIELRAGRLRCILQPERGGVVAGLWRDATPLLRPLADDAPASQWQAGLWPLVPFSNRVGQASVVWQGTQQPLVRHAGDAPHAIRGLAAHRPWSVLEADGVSAMLACEHRADAAWPFGFDCSHTFRLTPEALELTLALTNQAGKPAPASLGWQSFLAPRPGARLRVRTGGRWALDADRLPVLRHPDAGVDAPLEGLALDDCYDGWSGAATVRDDTVRLALSSDLARLVVHAAPDMLSLAPVSHVCNAVHLYAAGARTGDLGLSVLAPGETRIAQLRIALEETAA